MPHSLEMTHHIAALLFLWKRIHLKQKKKKKKKKNVPFFSFWPVVKYTYKRKNVFFFCFFFVFIFR